jgi:hypothetical protein
MLPVGREDVIHPVLILHLAQQAEQQPGGGRQPGAERPGPFMQGGGEIRILPLRLARLEEGRHRRPALLGLRPGPGDLLLQRLGVGRQAVGHLQQLGVALHHAQRLAQQLAPLLGGEQLAQMGQLDRQGHALSQAQGVHRLAQQGRPGGQLLRQAAGGQHRSRQPAVPQQRAQQIFPLGIFLARLGQGYRVPPAAGGG